MHIITTISWNSGEEIIEKMKCKTHQDFLQILKIAPIFKDVWIDDIRIQKSGNLNMDYRNREEELLKYLNGELDEFE
jgi:hypothetical protein